LSLLKDIKDNYTNPKKLTQISLDAIRVTIESCTCPKGNLCDTCKHLLEYYKWKKQKYEKNKHDAVEYIIDKVCTWHFGADYKEHGLVYNRDMTTLATIVDAYQEFLNNEYSFGKGSKGVLNSGKPEKVIKG